MTFMMSKIQPYSRVTDGVRLLEWRGTPFPGRPLVFLHGLGDGADVWRPVMRTWPEGPVNAVALDFPGHGGSAFVDPKSYTVAAMARWLADVLHRNDIRNPVLIGHSMGARVALEATLQGLVDPAHVVIVDVSPDPAGDPDDDPEIDSVIKAHLAMLANGAPDIDSFCQKVASRMQLADRAILSEVLPALVAAGGEPSGYGVRLRLDPEIARLLNGALEVDGWAALAALGCPGTIVRGEFSSALPLQTARKMQRSLRRPAGCFTVPKCGHAIPLEQPEALSRAIAQGLRGSP